MPIYEYKCPECGASKTQYNTVENRHQGPGCCNSQMDKVISTPSMIAPDIQPYKAVAGDQRWIKSRSEHRSFLRENGLVEVGNEGRPPDE